MGNKIDIVGKKFSMLTVLMPLKHSNGHMQYACKCDCGNTTVLNSQQLREGRTRSCGCMRYVWASQKTRRHGLSRTPIHNTWWRMIQRCTDPKDGAYKDYGARGITISEEWLTFENFHRDMGDRPRNATLDRIDNDKGYCKENCRWASKTTQANNRRTNKFLTFKGETLTYAQWEAKLQFRKGLLHDRIKKGWTVKRALTTPTANKYLY